MKLSMFNIRSVTVTGFALFAALCAGASVAEYRQARKITDDQARFFESKVRPVLAERCFSCHGAEKQAGGLRLDSEASLLKGGASGPALAAGDPENSALIRNIRYDGPVRMPPGGKLRADEIAALTEWVKSGARWPAPPSSIVGRPASGEMLISDKQQRFWSFRPVKRPTVPPANNSAWVRNPIDAFVLAKLRSKGLKPAPPADRRALIRRAFFDLIGLPPTPEEVAAFVADRSPDAWSKVIDNLLSSPHYGERWGRYWLDVVRYADSNGLDENKAFAHAFRYRDYVISAFNQDKPFDRFVTEQLAGDLLPADSEARRNEQTTATGFLVLGAKVLAEQDKPKLVMDVIDEQIEVTSKAFMGLTVACARCHDHKFDPISTRDYYALAGIFKSTRTMKNLGFVSEWMEKPLITDDLRARQKIHEQRVAAARAEQRRAQDTANDEVLKQFRKAAASYLVAGWEYARSGGLLSVAEQSPVPGEARVLVEAEKFDRGKGVAIDFDTYGKQVGVIYNIEFRDEVEWDVLVPRAGAYQVEFRYAAAEARPVRLLLNGKAIRNAAAGSVTGGWNAGHQRWEAQGVWRFPAGKNTLRIERDGPIPHFDKILIAAAREAPDKPSRTAEDIANEYKVQTDVMVRWAQRLRAGPGDPIFGVWHAFAAIPEADFAVRGPELARRVAQGELTPPAPQPVAAAFKGYSPVNLTEVASRYAELFNGPQSPLTDRFDLPEKPERFYSESGKALVKKAEAALKEVEGKAPDIPVAMAVEEAPKIENCRVHVRGSTLNLGDEVPRRFLSVIKVDRRELGNTTSGRLELAQWLTSRAHPLTSRVAVNRIWQGHFGHGLVRTPENWGLLGEKPTHPELLDWLAAEFMDPSTLPGREGPGGEAAPWSMKRLHRLIMLSNTYRMSTALNQSAMTADPENRLLWRMNRRRLEAEPFRDSLLAVSGNLDRAMGGTLLTTKNNDYVTNDQSGNAARYENHRRSVYLPVIRNAVFDMFQAFDFGDPSMVNAQRSSTTVAPQALFILNAPFAIEQARGLARRLLAQTGSTPAQGIARAYSIAYGRPPTPSEIRAALDYLERYKKALGPHEPDAARKEEKAWTSFSQILMASNEFIYVN